MKKDKRTFVFHLDWADVLNQQPDNIRLAVYDAIIDYVNNGNVPDAGTPVYLVFLFIKQQIDKDAERYEEVCEKRRNAGSKGGKQKVANVANATKCYQMQTNVADNDNEYDNDYDIIINDNSIIKEKINKKENEIENKIESAKETTTLIDQKEKEKEKSCAKKEKKVNVKFNAEELLKDEPQELQELLMRWIDYKKTQFGKTYKSDDSFRMFIKKLQTLSGGDFTKAKAIIEQSIANTYQGIFELTNYNKTQSRGYDTSESNNRLLDGIWDR